MGRIDVENTKMLRQAMDVLISVDETTEKPTSTSHTNCINGYDTNAKVTQMDAVVQLMDLCNGGFVNDGKAQPITSSSINGKYGYISSETANASGEFTNAPSITINSTSEWDYITLTLCDSKGNSTLQTFSPAWSNDTCTIAIESFTPHERCHIAKASLGKAWQFSSDTLISLSAILRGPNISLDTGEVSLEGSDIDFKAFVGADGDKYVDIFSRMEKDSEISFMCGYEEDMSALRSFYLSEASYDSNEKTLTIKGVDATISKLDENYAGKYVPGTYANVRQNYCNTIIELLNNSGVYPAVSGTMPSGVGSTESNLLFEQISKRTIIARAVAFSCEDFNLTYRDGGIPEIIIGNISTTWTINEEDAENLETEIEMNVREYDADLYTYKASSSNEEIASLSDCVAGQVYITDLSEPAMSVATSGATLITPYKLKYTASTSGSVSIIGKKVYSSTTATDNPRQVIDLSQRGVVVSLGDLPKVPYDDGSITVNAMDNMLSKSNLRYKFKWRGNPHMKPMDYVRMTRMGSGSRYIQENLYPSDTLYPLGAETITMQVISVSLEFEGGGLVSEIEARRCS